jgi:hypothetical protein
MKKLYTYIILPILLFNASAVSAQAPYHKMLASNYTDWYVFNVFIPVKTASTSTVNSMYLPAGKFTASTDTVLFSKNYKKMKHIYDYPGFVTNQLMGYMREDTIARKVYFLEVGTTTDKLLYDFSLSVGSTTLLDFPGTTGNFPNATYTVTAIDTVLTRAGYRKQFKLNASASDTLVYIESIGSIIHPLYVYQSNYYPGVFAWAGTSTCASYPYAYGVACKYADNEKQFQSCMYTLAEMNWCVYKYDSCNFYMSCSGIEEITSNIKHKLSPNPAANTAQLEIEFNAEEQISIDIYDVSGRRLKTLYTGKLLATKNSIQLDLSDFKNGYYFIKVNGTSIFINESIIIVK